MGNNFIRNRWLNYEGWTVSGFRVYGIAASVTSSRDGAPSWDCGCLACHTRQVRTHAELSGGVLYCSNAACPASRVERQAETSLRDLRRAERQEREQAERAEVARQASAAKDAANDAAIREEKKRYIKFAQAQLNVNVALEDLVSFETWCACSEAWRLDVLRRIGA